MFKRLSEPWVKGESLGFILGSGQFSEDVSWTP